MKSLKNFLTILVIQLPFFFTSRPASAINLVYTNFSVSSNYEPIAIENYELSEDDINDPTWWTLEDDRLYFSEYYGVNNSESPTSVPESTSTLGLLLLSAFVFIKSLTITKD